MPQREAHRSAPRPSAPRASTPRPNLRTSSATSWVGNSALARTHRAALLERHLSEAESELKRSTFGEHLLLRLHAAGATLEIRVGCVDGSGKSAKDFEPLLKKKAAALLSRGDARFPEENVKVMPLKEGGAAGDLRLTALLEHRLARDLQGDAVRVQTIGKALHVRLPGHIAMSERERLRAKIEKLLKGVVPDLQSTALFLDYRTSTPGAKAPEPDAQTTQIVDATTLINGADTERTMLAEPPLPSAPPRRSRRQATPPRARDVHPPSTIVDLSAWAISAEEVGRLLRQGELLVSDLVRPWRAKDSSWALACSATLRAHFLEKIREFGNAEATRADFMEGRKNELLGFNVYFPSADASKRFVRSTAQLEALRAMEKLLGVRNLKTVQWP